jgi:hypothetical protein
MSEQRHATVSAPVHLPVRTAVYDAVGSCTFPSAAYIWLLPSQEGREIHQQDIKQYNNRFATHAHYVHTL